MVWVSEVIDGERVRRPATPEEAALAAAWAARARAAYGDYGWCGEADCPCAAQGGE